MGHRGEAWWPRRPCSALQGRVTGRSGSAVRVHGESHRLVQGDHLWKSLFELQSRFSSLPSFLLYIPLFLCGFLEHVLVRAAGDGGGKASDSAPCRRGCCRARRPGTGGRGDAVTSPRAAPGARGLRWRWAGHPRVLLPRGDRLSFEGRGGEEGRREGGEPETSKAPRCGGPAAPP